MTAPKNYSSIFNSENVVEILTASIFERRPMLTPWKFLDRLPLLPSCKLGTVLAKPTLESGIDVGELINVGPGKFGKKNKRRALNTHVLCSK